MKPIITGDNRTLPKQTNYLSGKELKEFLYNNEITISHYNNKHSYYFYQILLMMFFLILIKIEIILEREVETL